MQLDDRVFQGIEPQDRRPVANLFGDLQWTYKGEMENQQEAEAIPPFFVPDGIPIEFVDGYTQLAMRTSKAQGERSSSFNVAFFLVLAAFVPVWVTLAIAAYQLVVAYPLAQRRFRRELALADQFYDRTIYRYHGMRLDKPKAMDIVQRVVRL